MSRLQIIVVSIAMLLLVGLYLGVRKKPLSHKDIEIARMQEAGKASINDIINHAKSALNETERNAVASLESELNIAGNDTTRLDVFKQLSSTWYQKQQFAASGFYAEEVAQLENTDSSWSISGVNYALCFTNTDKQNNERVYNFCYEKALTAFENAASIAPENIVHKENLAYCYTQNEDFQQVMQGVKIYLGILEQDSTNVKVLLALGKMSVDRSGDFGKALPRLEKAVQLAPESFEVNFYLGQTYIGLNRSSEARPYLQRALALTTNAEVKKNIEEIILNNL